MEDLAILASLIMGFVLLSGPVALVTAAMHAPVWLSIPASLLAMGLGMWWWMIPTGAWTLGPVVVAMGFVALYLAIGDAMRWRL